MLGYGNPRRHNADQAEARGIAKAVRRARYFAKHRTVELRCLFEFHRLIFERSNPRIAGQIRNADVKIAHSDHTPPPVPRLREYLRQFEGDLDYRLPRVMPRPEQMNYDSFIEIVSLAAWAQHRICWIHPFADGNGRCARLFCNLIHLRYELPPISARVEAQQRKRYRAALNQADKHGDYDPLIDIICEQLAVPYEEVVRRREVEQLWLSWDDS